MVLSKRERYIVIGVAVVGVALVVNQFAVEPLLAAIRQAEGQKLRLTAELASANKTLDDRVKWEPKWREWVRTGIKDKPEDAEGQAYNAIRNWAGECGVGWGLLRSDRLADKTQLPQIAFQFTGTGTMDSITRFLLRIQNATIPLRITELQLTSRKEGVDDLTITLRMSTVYLPGGKRPTSQSLPATAPVGVVR